MVVREVRPRVAIRAVVLANRSPLALARGTDPSGTSRRIEEAVLELAEALDSCPLSSAIRRCPAVSCEPAARCSPTRIALAMAVSAGLTAPMLGKKLVSTT